MGKVGNSMWRTGRALTVLVTGWVAGLALFLTPAVAAAPGVQQPAAAVRVAERAPQQVQFQQVEQVPQQARLQQARLQQAPDQQQDHPLPQNQRFTIGGMGIALIALVLLSRKYRKKPMVYIPKFWKKG